jgi:YVTN family beta-propeller protein
MYLPDPLGHGITAVDTGTNQVTGIIPIRNGAPPAAVAISPDGSTLYATDAAYGQLNIINLSLGKQIGRVGVGDYPITLGVSPDGARVFVLNYFSRSVSVVDARADQVVATIPIGGQPGDLVVQPNGNRVYVSATGQPSSPTHPAYDGQVAAIDGTTNQIIKVVRVQSGSRAMAISRDGRRLFVAHTDPASDQLDIIQTTDLSPEAPIPGGYALAVAIGPDPGHLFVLSAALSLVAAIDTSHARVVAVTPPTVEPRTLWSSPDGHRVYRKNADLTVSVFDAASLQQLATIDLRKSAVGRN